MSYNHRKRSGKVAETASNKALKIRYSGLSLLNVSGPVTGIIYRFTPAQPVQQVDARDGQLLLASKIFRI